MTCKTNEKFTDTGSKLDNCSKLTNFEFDRDVCVSNTYMPPFLKELGYKNYNKDYILGSNIMTRNGCPKIKKNSSNILNTRGGNTKMISY
jgi:hypothetical protein